MLTHWLQQVFSLRKQPSFFAAIRVGSEEGRLFSQAKSFLPKTYFFFGHFGLNIDHTSFNLLKKAFATWQQAFLFTSAAFYDIFAWACAEIKILRFWTRKWPTSLGFSFFSIFLGLSFSPFLIFLLQWLTFYWAYFPFKNVRKSFIETGKFCHWVASCSGRTFCFEIFTQISKDFRAYFRLHWADHSDLGIIGKIFSSCRGWT